MIPPPWRFLIPEYVASVLSSLSSGYSNEKLRYYEYSDNKPFPTEVSAKKTCPRRTIHAKYHARNKLLIAVRISR